MGSTCSSGSSLIQVGTRTSSEGPCPPSCLAVTLSCPCPFAHFLLLSSPCQLGSSHVSFPADFLRFSSHLSPGSLSAISPSVSDPLYLSLSTGILITQHPPVCLFSPVFLPFCVPVCPCIHFCFDGKMNSLCLIDLEQHKVIL